jgi:hypothetical protein
MFLKNSSRLIKNNMPNTKTFIQRNQSEINEAIEFITFTNLNSDNNIALSIHNSKNKDRYKGPRSWEMAAGFTKYGEDYYKQNERRDKDTYESVRAKDRS